MREAISNQAKPNSSSFLLLPESLGLNLARIRLCLKRFLLIGLISLTLVFFGSSELIRFDNQFKLVFKCISLVFGANSSA